MRTLIDIPDEDITALDALALRTGRSRAATVREAIKLLLVRSSDNSWIDRGFGLWADREDIVDGLEYQLQIREDRRAHEDI